MELIRRLTPYLNTVTNKAKWNVEYMNFSKKANIPLPPKRPMTAYMIFCKEHRNDLLRDNPGLRSPDQIKMLAEKWNQLTVDMKKPYEITAREGTQLYGEAHKKFYENLSNEQKEVLARLKVEKRDARKLTKLKKALKESGMPRPASSAYILYVQSQAGVKVESNKPSDFIKIVAEKWKNLSQNAKKDLEEKAQADKVRYSSEMAKWNEKLAKENKTNILKQYNELKSKSKLLDEGNEHHYLDFEDTPKHSNKQLPVSKN